MQVIYSVDCVFCTPCTWQLGTEKMNNKIEKKKKKKRQHNPESAVHITAITSHQGIHTQLYSTQQLNPELYPGNPLSRDKNS